MTADEAVVGRQGDVLRNGASLAEDGHHDIQAAQRDALTAISEAEADGFKVSEDLSVRDTRRVDVFAMAARQRAATEHAEDIRWRAEQLVQTDSLVGQRLQDKAVELDGIRALRIVLFAVGVGIGMGLFLASSFLLGIFGFPPGYALYNGYFLAIAVWPVVALVAYFQTRKWEPGPRWNLAAFFAGIVAFSLVGAIGVLVTTPQFLFFWPH